MDTSASMPDRGVEGGRGNSAWALDPPDQATLFEPPELKPEEFVRRLLRDAGVKKTVALAYYPAVEKRTKRPLKGAELEQHAKNAVGNLDRMLEGHNPMTVRLLDVIRRAVPGAGVAIAHFWADRGGTERGTPKLDLVRLQDEVLAIRAALESDASVRLGMVDRLKALTAYIERERTRR